MGYDMSNQTLFINVEHHLFILQFMLRANQCQNIYQNVYMYFLPDVFITEKFLRESLRDFREYKETFNVLCNFENYLLNKINCEIKKSMKWYGL